MPFCKACTEGEQSFHSSLNFQLLMPKTNQLQGRRILVGRARHQASALSTGLRARGAHVEEIPFIEIRKPRSYKPLDTALRNLDHYDWLILTSVNGVTAFWERLRKLRVNRNTLKHLKIAAIGPSTKKAIVQRGFRVHIVPGEYVAEAVVEALRDKINGKRVLLARAKVARDVIPQELTKAGAVVDVVEAYETVVPKNSRKRLLTLIADPKRRPDVITFTSSSTVKNFVALLGRHRRWKGQLKGINFASIGPVTSSTLREMNLDVHAEANKYTIPGLVQAITKLEKPLK
jgi:uroporphyrinogen-III synthase